MAEYHFASSNLEAFGPTLEIDVRVPTALAKVLVAQNGPVPPPCHVTAIIDTGASWCLFTPDVNRRLQIEPFDVATISTASAVNHPSNVYNIDLELPGHRVRNLTALEADLSGVPAQG